MTLPPSDLDLLLSELIERLRNAGKSEQMILASWALDCAERVLPFFEENRPSDPRPWEAIESGRAWICGEIRVNEARNAAFAAHEAARNATDPSAVFAARSAGHAAATAHTSGHAIHAANYAIKAVPIDRKIGERTWQYDHLLELLSAIDTL